MTSWELQKIIHDKVKNTLSIGMSEKDLADIISGVCKDWQGDLISGERTSLIEGGPTDRIIKNGDVVMLDLQVNSQNQWSDLTRVYFIGGISEEQKNAYESVVKAIKTGEEYLRVGVKANTLWSVMRDAINSVNAFSHHGGHRIGSNDEIVVNPRFIPESDEELKAGMIVTLEPGIYIPDKFGIRLENNYLITENGFDRLDSLSLNLNDYIVKG